MREVSLSEKAPVGLRVFGFLGLVSSQQSSPSKFE